MHPLFTTLSNIIIFAGIVQGFFFAAVLTTKKNKNKKSNRTLAMLMILLSISILHTVFTSGNIIDPLRIKEPLILLIGPLLLFYVNETSGIKSGGTRNIYHFVPFLLFLLLFLVHSIFLKFIRQNSIDLSIGLWIIIVIQYGYYWVKILGIMRNLIASVESEFSNIEGKTLSWLKKFLHAFGILLLLFTGTVIFVIHGGNYADVDPIVAFGLSLTIFYLGYEGLFQEEIFANKNRPSFVEERTGNQIEKPIVSNIEQKELYKQVLDYFNDHKPYLDEELTLTKLAAELNVTRNLLSSAINNNSGNNFYTFVNKYRIDEVLRLLADPKNKDFTILSLAYEAGFPSKSSFHNIFKKFTGMTPTEYQSKLKK